MKILIIDATESLAEYSNTAVYTVLTASSLTEAKAVIERDTFDLALVNFRMLDSKGPEIVNLIKDKKPGIKIIDISEKDQSGEFYTAGIDSFIEKPFDDKEILEILNRRSQQETISKKPHILIVDDHQELREYLSFILKEKYTTANAGSVKDAMRYMDDYSVNLILLDYEMPNINGLTALGEIRKRHPDTVVIMMCGSAPAYIKQKALDLGAFAFYVKPFDIDKLLVVIDKAVQELDFKN